MWSEDMIEQTDRSGTDEDNDRRNAVGRTRKYSLMSDSEYNA